MHSLIPLIKTIGYLGVFAIVFAESGLLIGFFFPGDTLLFAAGILAHEHYFNIVLLILGASIAAIIGDSTGYWFGKKAGPAIFTRNDSLFFKKEYVEKAQAFFAKYGRKTIVLSRYVPVVRTFVPVIAGVGVMRYRTFFLYNVIGGIAWCASMSLVGYYLGAKIPNIDAYVLPLVVAVFVLSFVPVVLELLNRKKKRHSGNTVI